MKLMPEIVAWAKQGKSEATKMKTGSDMIRKKEGIITGRALLAGAVSGITNANLNVQLNALLSSASSIGRLKVIDVLLDLGANVDGKLFCALIEASKNNQCDVIRHFAERGISIADCTHAKSALKQAATPEVAALLRELGVKE